MAVIEHRGHRISVTRERSLGGPFLLYISIIRLDDCFIVEETPYDGAETINEMLTIMKNRVDREIAEGSSYEPNMETLK